MNSLTIAGEHELIAFGQRNSFVRYISINCTVPG
jgi:hypothetical protein